MDFVFIFVELQRLLTRAFAELYPDVKDFKWLLDFPKNGEMLADGSQWRFVKHGAGLRFEKLTREPHWVVDIHKCFDEPNIIDVWRILQFFESCGEYMDENQIASLLDEMCLSGHLINQDSGQYLFVR